MKKILLILLTLVLVTGCGCSKKDNKKDENKDPNKDLASFEEKSKNGLTLKEVNLNYENGFTNMYAIIKNTTAEDIPANDISIFMYDKDGNQTGEVFCYIGGAIKANSEEVCETAITSNITHSVKFDFEINNN